MKMEAAMGVIPLTNQVTTEREDKVTEHLSLQPSKKEPTPTRFTSGLGPPGLRKNQLQWTLSCWVCGGLVWQP